MYQFLLPDLGEGVHEAEILKWYVQPGEPIEEDDPLVDVETDKASVTIPSPRAGTIRELAGNEGDTITVGQMLALIDDGTTIQGTQPIQVSQNKTQGNIQEKASQAKQPAPPKEQTPQRTNPVPAPPATRRLARELGLDIQQVPASGPAGRVTDADVRRYFEQSTVQTSRNSQPSQGSIPPSATTPASQPGQPASATTPSIPLLELESLPDFAQEGPISKVGLRSIRRKVAKKMVRSSILAAHVAHMDEADVTELEDFRKQYNTKHKDSSPHLTLLTFVVKAITAGLKAFPVFNASVDPQQEEIIYKKYYNIGVAVDTSKGLVVPVVRDTACKSLNQIAADIFGLADRGRQDQLELADLRGGTFTITNIGPLGGTGLIPLINYPEVAILGMGRVQERARVVEGQLTARKILPLTLSFDHRIADGGDAARFVSNLVNLLSHPHQLLLDT